MAQIGMLTQPGGIALYQRALLGNSGLRVETHTQWHGVDEKPDH
ncbi:hypothetical protein MMSP_0617 [Mycobacterium sp. 012931]|nr:hypothetical protein MMSP_0617 [Mycobacterium sp. 012931]